MKKTSLTTIAIGTTLALAACSGTDDPDSSPGTAEQVLIIGTTQEPAHLNPAVQSGMGTGAPGAQLFASPVRYEDDFEPKPYLARSWDTSADGMSVTLHLEEEAVFHDGEPITSEDVAFSLEVVKAEHPFGANLFGPVETVETPDEHTAVIKLSEPHPALMIAMSPPFLPVLPKHVYGTADVVSNHAQNSQQVVGSGPYELAEHSQSQRVVVTKFDDFFMDDEPYLDQIIFEIFSDDNTMVLAQEAGETHLTVTNVPQSIQRLGEAPNITVSESGYEALGSITWLGFNLENEFLNDVRVRQAIAYAIDTEYIFENIYSGIGQVAPSAIHPDSPYFNEAAPRYVRDLDAASALLDDAGYPEAGDGTRFSLAITALHDNLEAAEIIRANLADVGVDVTVQASPDFSTWSQNVANYNYDMTMDNVWNWADPVVGVERTYRCDNIVEGVVWANMSQYCNPEVDDLFDRAAVELDEEARAQLYGQVQELLGEDLPVYWMYAPAFVNATSAEVDAPPNGIFGLISPMLTTQMG